jgi:hypothetical protein
MSPKYSRPAISKFSERQYPDWRLISREIFTEVCRSEIKVARSSNFQSHLLEAVRKCYCRVKVFNSSVENFVEKASASFENAQND